MTISEITDFLAQKHKRSWLSWGRAKREKLISHLSAHYLDITSTKKGILPLCRTTAKNGTHAFVDSHLQLSVHRSPQEPDRISTSG